MLGQQATKICYSQCTVTNTVAAFSISGRAVDPADGAKVDGVNCPNDFISIIGGTSGTDQADRYCGAALNAAGNGATEPATVCSK